MTKSLIRITAVLFPIVCLALSYHSQRIEEPMVLHEWTFTKSDIEEVIGGRMEDLLVASLKARGTNLPTPLDGFVNWNPTDCVEIVIIHN